MIDTPSDTFTLYETGLNELLDRLDSDQAHYTNALALEAQLRENINRARLGEDSENRRADRNRIVRQLNRLASNALGLSFNELCGAPDDGNLAFRVEIEFVNRENELDLLHVERLRASRSPYTLINAPAGYGKSYLLRRLIRTVKDDQSLRQKWAIRYVNFGQKKVEAPRLYLIQVVSGEVEPSTRQDEPSHWIDDVCSHVIQELSTPLPQVGGRRAVLLIFDAVDRLDEKATRWLYSLLNDLHQRTRSGHQEIITVRVIVAGRDAETFWEGYEQAYPKLPAPQRVNLSPFDDHPIQELIWSQARAAQITLDDHTVDQIANEVQYLGGGHPMVIRGLVDHLASQSFAIGPVSAYFSQHRRQLVRSHLSPVVDDLLESLEVTLDPQTKDVVQILSVFRRVNANTVQALVSAGILPPETDEIDLLGDMQRAHLLDGPGIREPFYRDHLMRRIWVLDMAYRSQESKALYHRLNKIALDLYTTWIHNLGQDLPDTPLKATQQLLSVVEWLFHALQEESMTENDLRSGLQQHIKVLSQDDQPHLHGTARNDTGLLVANLIADEIKQDDEVCYLARHRLGDNGVSIICNWLQPA